MLQGKLFQEEIFVSAMCQNTKNMLMQLEAEPENPDKPKRSKWIHKFDSVTYPMFKSEVGGGARVSTGAVVPSIIKCGTG